MIKVLTESKMSVSCSIIQKQRNMNINNCKDFSDLLLAVINYGADIKSASKKFWSAKKYRNPEEIKWARMAYPDYDAIIDKITLN